MLSTNIYKIKQTENVNKVAEEYGNIVGRYVKIMHSSKTAIDKYTRAVMNGSIPDVDVRVYITDGESNHGPILGLTINDLELIGLL